jgi:hypothetical protein
MNIHISASELAILTGHNTYRSSKELVVKYWKKYWNKDYERILDKMKSNEKKIVLPETSSETIQRIAKENNISKADLGKIYQSSKQKDTGKMKQMKECAVNEVLKKIPESQRNLFQKSANSVAYTGFGTRNETNAVKIYENLTGKKVETLNKYFHDDVFIIEEFKDKPDVWSVGGKIDGIFPNEDGTKTVLEIKNRMNGLFKTLRDYEKVQCYAYMFMLNLKCVHLAECYKKKDSSAEMNIIEINWDEDFWFNQVINPLSKFVDDFYDILKNDEKKIELLSNS